MATELLKTLSAKILVIGSDNVDVKAVSHQRLKNGNGAMFVSLCTDANLLYDPIESIKGFKSYVELEWSLVQKP